MGRFAVNTELELVRVSLNPFEQSATGIGRIVIGETWTLPQDLEPLFPFLSDACPTLSMLHTVFREDEAAVLAAYLRTLPDAREVRDRVEEYFGDPFTRVGEEIASAALAAVQRSNERRAPLDGAEAAEFAAAMVSIEHRRPELRAFARAWAGAIDHTPRPATMSAEAFGRAFKHIASQMD